MVSPGDPEDRTGAADPLPVPVAWLRWCPVREGAVGEDAARQFSISHTGADRPWAEWIAATLDRAGCTTHLQARDSPPGSDFVHLVQRAASGDARTIAVLSPACFRSRFAEAEWRAAFARDPTGERGLLLPVRVQPCEPPGLLASRVYVDLVGADEGTARRLLPAGAGHADPDRAAAPSSPGGGARFPGAGPEVSDVPRRDRRFTGRDADLARLHADLLAAAAAGDLPIQAVHGLGGVGKTTLALEYAHRFAGDHDTTWWLDADRPTTVTAGLARLAARLGVTEGGDQPEMVQALFDLLRHRDRWLLVYDDAESPGPLADLLPTGGGGHVLVTSRWTAWGRYATALPLSTLPRAASLDFLRRRTGHTDQEALDVLADLVGDLPLALEEAAAYLEETRDDLRRYTDLLRTRGRDLLGLTAPAAVEVGDHRRVATVWSISLDRIHRHAPAAEALLDLCAFLAPDVPRDLPAQHPGVLPGELAAMVGDPLRYNDTLAAISRFSLATVGPGSIGLHRLVQMVVQARLAEADERTWVTAAVRLLREAFPDDSWETSSWQRCERLLPHLLAATGHAERLGVAGEETGWLLDRAATYLRERGQYRQARPSSQARTTACAGCAARARSAAGRRTTPPSPRSGAARGRRRGRRGLRSGRDRG